MEEKFELIEHIHHDASMSNYTITKLIEKLKDKDNKIKAYLEEILKKYQEFQQETETILKQNNKEISEPTLMAKMGSSMGITKEVVTDNSDSAIASMMIEGVTMGSIEIKKELDDYDKELDKEHKKIGKEFLKFQEKTIDQLKKYL